MHVTNRNINRFQFYICVILAVLFVLAASVICAAAGTGNEGEGAGSVQIQIGADAPCVGVPLTAVVTGDAAGLTPHWYVGGEDVGCRAWEYVPTAADYEAFITVQLADEAGTVIAQDSIYFSKLPVVYIMTAGDAAAINRDEYMDAEMYVQGNAVWGVQYDGTMQIKGRGTGSWHYDKKPYKLKLDSKADLFGFGATKHYILLSEYLDPTLLRNAVAYDVSREMGLTASDYQRVDVVMNGTYLGSYLLGEHMRVGAQFVDIYDWEDLASDLAKAVYKANKSAFPAGKDALEEYLTQNLSWITDGTFTFDGITYAVADYIEVPDDVSGGYLIELDTGYASEITNFRTDKGIDVVVKKPEYLCSNETMLAYVQDVLQKVEDAVNAPDGYADGVHWSELVDVDSMVAYWLCMEVLANDDAASRSRYCYLDLDGKLTFGPVWDFDMSANSYRSIVGSNGWAVTSSFLSLITGQDFFKEFVDDPYFQVKARELYWQMRPYFAALVEDGGIIEQMTDAWCEATLANETLWCLATNAFPDITRTYSGENGDYTAYITFLRQRLTWLDSVFETRESTARALYSLFSSNAYKQNNRSIRIKADAPADTAEHGADYRIAAGSNLVVNLKCPRRGTTSVYVNGILFGTYYAALDIVIELPADVFTEAEGKANVIAVRTTLEGRKRAIRNDITVVVGEEAPVQTTDTAAYLDTSLALQREF